MISALLTSLELSHLVVLFPVNQHGQRGLYLDILLQYCTRDCRRGHLPPSNIGSLVADIYQVPVLVLPLRPHRIGVGSWRIHLSSSIQQTSHRHCKSQSTIISSLTLLSENKANNLVAKPSYAVSSTLIIIAPVFVAAGNYLLIGRLIRAVLPPSRHRIFLIPAHLITRTFVGCDILSFLIQASGSGIASSTSWEGNNAKIGTDVLVGGLSTQVATFVWFLCIVGRFWWVAKTETREGAPRGWRRVLQAIWVSSSLILVHNRRTKTVSGVVTDIRDRYGRCIASLNSLSASGAIPLDMSGSSMSSKLCLCFRPFQYFASCTQRST